MYSQNKQVKYLILTITVLVQFLAISHAQLPSYLPTNGLVAWYPFNGNANDESGNGNDGVVNGAALCSDQWANESRAYDFSGADCYIEIANSPIESQGTLIAWVLPRSAAAEYNNWDYSASLIDQNFGAQNNSGVGLYYHNTIHGLYAEVGWSGNTNNFINANPIKPLALSNWQHVVFSFTQSSCSLYLNGELIANRTDMNAASMSTSNLYFGRAPWGGNQFNGVLDDIAIYNRALSAAEVTELYTASATGTGNGTTSTTTSPPGIPYQAEVRNESGEVLANANVNVRFTLHELAANGSVSYQETHALATNELGLFAAIIGAGTTVQGTFASINWAQTTKFLQVEVDTGSGWITMGNQQLMSVPYAMYAANGPAGPQGPAGADGQNGIDGQNGVSIYNAYIENGQLYLVLTDNTIISAGSVNNGGGCTNPLACNFNPSYSYDNGSCYYPGYPCDDNNPETQGEVYDQFCQCSVAVPGCTNSLACNYNPAANQDNGSCITLYGPCSDGIITTVNDYINEDCQCVGFTTLSNGTIGNGVTDASGNNYPTVIIGGQEWMAENLRTTKYANGDLIGYNLTASDWNYTQWGAWTNAFERSPGLINVHGNLYNRYAAIDSRNVCPANYHIPSATEWNTLLTNLGSSANLLWTAPNFGIPSVSGFSGLLTQNTYGFYQGNECASEPPGCMATSYAATDNGGFTYFVLGYGVGYINVGAGGPNYGTPIRCVKD
jgi:uncharacterized protein (TIGR02145 family)